jgi:mannose-1-phosphate guanylyltransferase / phosphomannomutase
LSTTDKPTVCLPVAVSRTAEEMCVEAGAEILWTKLSTAHLMETASTSGADFAASQEGGYIFPAFLPAYDAVATFVETMGMLSRTGVRLSKIVAGVPRIHTAHEAVVTPWEQKGMVMRTLMENAKGHDLVLVDGVKIIHDDGWALVLPDPEEPVTHVWTEGASDGEATALAQDYARRIRQLLR